LSARQAGLLNRVKYPAPLGENWAYLTPASDSDQTQPGIVWIVGGFASEVSSTGWEKGDLENDQSAAAFREAGIATLRGSSQDEPRNVSDLKSSQIVEVDQAKLFDYIRKLPDGTSEGNGTAEVIRKMQEQ